MRFKPPYIASFLFLNTVGFFLHRKTIRPWTTVAAGMDPLEP